MAENKIDPVQAVEDAVIVGSSIASNPKGFWKSKTFWFNLVTVGLHYVGFLPPHATVPVLVAGNIALRGMSSGSVTLTGK